MEIISILFIIFGLCLFEIITSIDNAIINAEVLSTMKEKMRRWFLLYGFFIAVILIRGLLPWGIVWASNPSIGPIGALTATFSNDPKVIHAIENSSPILLMGGGIFLVFLFFHWLFLEPKNYGLKHEKFFHEQGVWFYAVISIILSYVSWYTIKLNPMLTFGAIMGSTIFFIVHGFKQNAEESEKKLLTSGLSDWSKILYLEIIDATFSIDGVVGAFAFTLSVPLILLGNGLGAFFIRKFTVSNIENIKKYVYLKNGAMYSILFLGIIMMLDGFGLDIPEYISPITTFLVVGFFLYKSKIVIKKSKT